MTDFTRRPSLGTPIDPRYTSPMMYLQFLLSLGWSDAATIAMTYFGSIILGLSILDAWGALRLPVVKFCVAAIGPLGVLFALAS